MADALGGLRIGDILTFLAVARTGSITGASRELHVTPSYVSKSITRLESQLRMTLLARSSRRVTMTDAGLRILPQLKDVVSRLQSLGRSESRGRALTIGGPSYMSNFFLPRLAQQRPTLRLRSIELPPALVRAYATDNFFDVALTLGVQQLPASWISTEVGEVRKALFASPALASRLGRQPIAVDRLRDVAFVGPLYNVGGQFIVADDDCPLAAGQRKMGHEVTTVALALDLASRCDQVVFAPAIAAEAHLKRRALVEIAVRGWDVREQMYVACNADRVRAEDQRTLIELLRRTLAG